MSKIVSQGRLQEPLLESSELPYDVLPTEAGPALDACLATAVAKIKETNGPYGKRFFDTHDTSNTTLDERGSLLNPNYRLIPSPPDESQPRTLTSRPNPNVGRSCHGRLCLNPSPLNKDANQ